MTDPPSGGPVSPVPGGARIRVHVQPRASRTATAGLHGGALKVRLAAPPVDGAANEALLRWLAEALDVPRAAVTLTAGAGSRAKTIDVAGVDPDDVRARLGLDPR